MKIVILIGIIAFISFSIWYAKKSGITSEYSKESKVKEVSTLQDKPIDFGYKIVWIAVKTDDKIEVANILKLKNQKPCNWKSGIESAYENSVFITPQIGNWTLAVGMKLPYGDTLESIEKLENVLNKLSSKFGEAQFFGTHRVVEYHHWIKSVNGKTVRMYNYIGDIGQNIKVFGKLTEPELGLDLFNSLSIEAQSESYWEREDLDYPNEELVMKVAEKWSVNPTKLSKRTDIKKELGLILN